MRQAEDPIDAAAATARGAREAAIDAERAAQATLRAKADERLDRARDKLALDEQPGQRVELIVIPSIERSLLLWSAWLLLVACVGGLVALALGGFDAYLDPPMTPELRWGAWAFAGAFGLAALYMLQGMRDPGLRLRISAQGNFTLDAMARTPLRAGPVSELSLHRHAPREHVPTHHFEVMAYEPERGRVSFAEVEDLSRADLARIQALGRWVEIND
ncbi:MAG: hypothetical protein R3A79_19440 [Nannocystaceae bacterium]